MNAKLGKKIISFGNKWLCHEFSSGCHPGEDYLKFQTEYRSVLRAVAEEAGYKLVKFNKNHYCFSAVLQEIETQAYAYVSISDVRGSSTDWFYRILYRQMENANDWKGKENHYCDLSDLDKCLKRLYK